MLKTPQPMRSVQPTVKVQRLAYLLFQRPDLAKAEQFLSDFGLTVSARFEHTLYLRGTDSSPFCYRVERAATAAFVGFGFMVASREDLFRLAALPGASNVEAAPYPGGGERVKLRDPAGFIVEAVFGQATVFTLPHRNPLTLNLAEDLLRINASQRAPAAAPEILKLGHVVLEVAHYQATCAWYTQHLGLIPSDVHVLDDGSPAVAFMRLDLGDKPADHHTLALAQGFMSAYSHSAFEVVDIDAVGMGQRVLRERGWTHAWGIGRHILGSQIFDYWQDPWGDKHEHYCDGDVFTAQQPTELHGTSKEHLAQWGQSIPRSFTKPKLNLINVRALLHNLRHCPDLTIRKMITLARLFG
ncbi:VOC family protein [Pseudomonas sp. MAFF 301449]|uniref:VOC family protein n=1 Tax=Pseudomonas cyclaminis TaxID=2781239 RepID=A0ABR9SRQ1_9PSED|nr:2,4,5-trihydroxytoluene oxygenase [Pseudomonas cyclaminis]MBE8591558.1 VOC family protein [Pseudomonas cyclaminis]MBE8598647.1 VOC family protein [Pseudomonas cyclaminis]